MRALVVDRGTTTLDDAHGRIGDASTGYYLVSSYISLSANTHTRALRARAHTHAACTYTYTHTSIGESLILLCRLIPFLLDFLSNHTPFPVVFRPCAGSASPQTRPPSPFDDTLYRTCRRMRRVIYTFLACIVVFQETTRPMKNTKVIRDESIFQLRFSFLVFTFKRRAAFKS